MKSVAVIPAFNEGKTIFSVIIDVKKFASEAIVVNDASSDDTAEVARRAGAMVISHERNQGYDTTLNDGFSEAAKIGADIIFTIDADGEHSPTDIPKMLTPIEEGRADIVLGQRPHTTHLSEAIFALYTRLRFGVADPLCGFKAYRTSVYTKFGAFDTFGSIGTELAFRGISAGFSKALVPIELKTRENDSSRFYARSFRANLKILRAMWRTIIYI